MTSREFFDIAIISVLDHEGSAFTDHPEDKGGPTKFGIAKKFHPDVDVVNLTRAQAIEIYWGRYWDGNGYEKLPLDVGVKLFNLAVNMGQPQAIKILQRALRAVGHEAKDDGMLGPMTIAATHRVESDDDIERLFVGLRCEAAGVYRVIVAKNPTQTVFLKGWLNRAYT